jgi:Adenine-specific methyltransferase EcoRI
MTSGKTKEANSAMAKSMNRSLHAAKSAKQDEFYTQYIDVQREVEAYLEFDPNTFKGKIVYCNCDDPFESNFFKYFAANFNKLGLKKLITTSYDGSPIAGQMSLFPEHTEGNGKRARPKAVGVILDRVKDENGDGAADIEDVKLFLKKNKAARIALKADEKYHGGDFRSDDCVELLKQADIVVTNPPFSLMGDYLPLLVRYEKNFLILGNQNHVTLKEVFPLIRETQAWLGVDNGGEKWFQIQEDYEFKTESRKKRENGIKYFSRGDVVWFTNLDHGRRHQELPLMTMADNLKFSKRLQGQKAYENYDNYDAIAVGTYKDIPSDYDGVMGVPITFLYKYNPSQFEIVGICNDVKDGLLPHLKRKDWNGKLDRPYLNGKRKFPCLLIRHRNPKGKRK